jgi:hypothetical protein
MNDKRRKAIAEIIEKLEALKENIDDVRDGEQEAYDNLPESFQHSIKGANMVIAIEAIEGALEGIEDAITNLGAAMEAQ